MCGIVGLVGIEISTAEDLLETIGHRGPDSSGYYKNDKIFLGHTRLSILDLSENGSQPMYSPDGRYLIIFNGEIYNHWDIRKELENDFTFNSSSDTETLLYGYIKFGVGILNRLNGIFAFAIYDVREKEIFLARDQLGVKPLYYYQSDDKFMFSSEIKSFLSYISDKKISTEAIANYLTFLWSPGTKTAFRKVLKLLPGHYIKVKTDGQISVEVHKYYQIPFDGGYSKKTEAELVDILEEKLIAAVRRQMLSDVPVGFFLSGGLDSSLLVAIARKICPERELSCFTINANAGAGDEGFIDDLPYAKKVAEYLNVELNIVNAEVDIFSEFDKMIWHLDEPQADVAPLNVLNICRFARQKGIKVLIGGTGGDDLFSGYRRHKALSLEKYFNALPKGAGKAIVKIIDMFPIDKPIIRRLKKLSHGLDKDSASRMAEYFSWLPYQQLKKLFSERQKLKLADQNPINQLIALNQQIPFETNKLNQMLYWEINSFLVNHNLNYTDKLSMAVGVEARVPYLDKEIVEFSTNIPPSLKMIGKETKYILKKVAERYLPMDVIYRRKTGFGAPVRKWILNDLDLMIKERLSPERIIERGLFDPVEVWNLIEENRAGKIDASYTILALLAIESWMSQFLETSVNIN